MTAPTENQEHRVPAEVWEVTGRQVPCSTCKRLGRVPVALLPGTVLSYCGPNGERQPYEICRTCGGTGWTHD